MDNKKKLIEIKNLFQIFDQGTSKEVCAVNDISFDIYQGETFGLVGESGCGKSTTGRTIIGLYEATKGQILYDGVNVCSKKKDRKARKEIAQKMQMIFQDPMSSLNSKMIIGDIVAEGIDIHGLASNSAARSKIIEELLGMVGLHPSYASRYPHELSGGQRQRIGIARALAVKPEFIVADEPISALDVSIQAQVVNLLKKLQREQKLTYLFIAHDLSMVRYVSDRIGVMYAGRLMELASSEDIYNCAYHPYTKSLLSAIPVPDPDKERTRKRTIYNASEDDDLKKTDCKLREIAPGHFVRCSEEKAKSIIASSK